MDGFGAESCVLYFFSHMFGPQEYTLANIKVVSALVLDRIFCSIKVIRLSCQKAAERTVLERNLAVYIFF